jgi:hypothetical protein
MMLAFRNIQIFNSRNLSKFYENLLDFDCMIQVCIKPNYYFFKRVFEILYFQIQLVA